MALPTAWTGPISGGCVLTTVTQGGGITAHEAPVPLGRCSKS